MKAGSSFNDAVRDVGESHVRRDAGDLDIEVVEHLEVVGHESDRTHDDRIGHTLLPQPPHLVTHVGAEPGLWGAPGALPRHQPFAQAGCPGHQPGRLGQLIGIGVACLSDALRQRVRGEDDAGAPGDAVARVGDPRREELDQSGLGVPGSNRHERRRAERGRRPVEVLLRSHRRPVWGEDEADHPLETGTRQAVRRVLNERVDVLGTEGDDVALRRSPFELGA